MELHGFCYIRCYDYISIKDVRFSRSGIEVTEQENVDNEDLERTREWYCLSNVDVAWQYPDLVLNKVSRFKNIFQYCSYETFTIGCNVIPLNDFPVIEVRLYINSTICVGMSNPSRYLINLQGLSGAASLFSDDWTFYDEGNSFDRKCEILRNLDKSIREDDSSKLCMSTVSNSKCGVGFGSGNNQQQKIVRNSMHRWVKKLYSSLPKPSSIDDEDDVLHGSIRRVRNECVEVSGACDDTKGSSASTVITTTHHCYITSLPDELIRLIIGYLDAVSLCRLCTRTSCKALYRCYWMYLSPPGLQLTLFEHQKEACMIRQSKADIRIYCTHSELYHAMLPSISLDAVSLPCSSSSLSRSQRLFRRLPKPHRTTTLLPMNQSEMHSYNAIVSLAMVNLVTTELDYSFANGTHPDSLLHSKNSPHLKQMLRNIRIAACGGGHAALTLSTRKFNETMELLQQWGKSTEVCEKVRRYVVHVLENDIARNGHDVRRNTNTASMKLSRIEATKRAMVERQHERLSTIHATTGANSELTNPHTPDSQAASQPRLQQHQHDQHEGLEFGCESCGIHLEILLITPCGCLYCPLCLDELGDYCVNCCNSFDWNQLQLLQPGFEGKDYVYTAVPNGEVEAAPHEGDINREGMVTSGSDYDGAKSTKCQYLIKRIREVSACDRGIYFGDTNSNNNHTNTANCAKREGGRVGFVDDGACQSGVTHVVTPPVKTSLFNSSPICSSKIIVFSQFPEFLDNIAIHLKESNITYLDLNKKTKATTILNNFKYNSTHKVLLLGKLGSLGLDLSFVTHIFLMEPILDRSLEEQLISRAYRIGAQQSVKVELLLMRHTIEEVIYHTTKGEKQYRNIRVGGNESNSFHNRNSVCGGGEEEEDDDDNDGDEYHRESVVQDLTAVNTKGMAQLLPSKTLVLTPRTHTSTLNSNSSSSSSYPVTPTTNPPSGSRGKSSSSSNNVNAILSHHLIKKLSLVLHKDEG